MLAVSPLRNPNNDREAQMEGFSIDDDATDFLDFAGSNLLDSIDFDDIFVGISDGDVLPDLEMDPDILADFSVGEDSDSKISSSLKTEDDGSSPVKRDDSASATAASGRVPDKEPAPANHQSPTSNKSDKGRKSSTGNAKNPPGKRKVKVDWTPELHRRFVQAVEQLGVDKAVPSRILELMGIDCLTRHNIASHLQKYRSHRKHLLAREAEAASWGQRRQAFGGSGSGSTSRGKRDVNPWIAPTMGFPPPHFRPLLHVWGHPSVDQQPMHMWSKHQIPQPQAWPPAQPPLLPTPVDPSFWFSHHQHVPTPGTPCFPPHLATARYPTALVPGIPPPAMIKVEPSGIGYPTVAPGQALPRPPSDVHPSKESVDAAIGDVLSKPWLPLPLGLKPPSVDSVMVELQRQGVSKMPPTCVANGRPVKSP